MYNRSNSSDFVSLLQSRGFFVTFVLYVRSQIVYLARIYLTLLLFGLDLTFDDVLRPTLVGLNSVGATGYLISTIVMY